MKKYRKIIALLAISVLTMAGSVSAETISGNSMEKTELAVQSVSANSSVFHGMGYYDIDKKAPEYDEKASYARERASVLPAKYRSDQVDTNGDGIIDKSYVASGYRDQGLYGTCWAFSALGSCEAGLIRKGLATNDLHFSINHLAYLFYNKGSFITDRLGQLSGDYNLALQDNFLEQGGNSYFTMWHLASGAGPVDEAKDEKYQYQNINKNYSLPATTDEVYQNSEYRLKDCSIINTNDRYSMKQMIEKNGALGISYYGTTSGNVEQKWYDSYAAGKNTGDEGSYYCDREHDTNHAVLVIGWDDNYPADNFVRKPAGNGAWLIKNSWGDENTSASQDGCFWISYYDKGLSEVAYAYECESINQYQNCYQYDGASGGEVLSLYQAANVFTAHAANGKDEAIKAVSVGVDNSNAAYKIDIYANDGTGDVTKDNLTKGRLLATKSGVFQYAGYHTVELDQPVVVSAGQKYVVLLTFTSGNGQINYDMDVSYDWIAFETNSLKGESFYKATASGSFNECSAVQILGGNVRIKAFTDNLDTKLGSVSVSKSALSMEVGNQQTLTATVTGDSPNKIVAWASTNPSVATVSNGVITAKGYGQCTIVAALGNGSKAYCKVNVTTTNYNVPMVTGVKSVAANKVLLQWIKGGDADGYEIYRSTTKKGTYKKVKTISSKNITEYTDGGRSCGNTYYYKVRYFKYVGGQKVYGAYSKYYKVKTVPAAVENVKVKTGGRKNTISWKKVSKASGYEIYRSTKPGSKGKKIAVVGKKNKYTDKNKVKAGKTYYYKIRAYQVVKGKKVYGSYSAQVN